MSYDAPFAGLKVVDLSQGIAGPYCAMLLAQNGADVVKVEPVESGDWSRGLGAIYGDHTAYSIAGNLGKRSLALDLKSDDGRAVLWRVLEGADVFVEGFRPGAIKRLGFDYAAVSARQPRILYLSVSGFGQTGPLAERPAMDPVLQAFTGMMVENKGEDGIPHRVPFIPVDMATGLYAFQAISAALYARQSEPNGRYIETSLMQTAAAVQVVRMMATYLEGGTMQIGGPSGIYATADGWISITIVRGPDWHRFCTAIERPDLEAEPRYADRDGRQTHEAELRALIKPILAAKPGAHWAERFGEVGLLFELLSSYFEFLKQPQVEATGLIAWLAQPGLTQPAPVPNIAGRAPLAAGTPLAAAPTLGEHSEAILQEHGYTPAQIADLAARRVIRGPVRARTAS